MTIEIEFMHLIHYSIELSLNDRPRQCILT